MSTAKQAVVLKAAIIHNGSIFTGYRYSQITLDVWALYPNERILEEDRGFLTSLGQFVSKEQALEIAIAAGQISKRADWLCLFPEDLWPEPDSDLVRMRKERDSSREEHLKTQKQRIDLQHKYEKLEAQ